MSIAWKTIRAPRFAQELLKWAVFLVKFLSDPSFPGDVNIAGSLDVDTNLNVDGDATIDGDRLWSAVGGLYENETPLTVSWAGGEVNAWKDITGLTNGGDPTRITEDGTNGVITVTNAGKYMVGFDVSVSANAGLTLHCKLARDSGAGYSREDKLAFRRDIGAGGIYGDASCSFPLTLVAGEKLKVQLQSDTANRTITMDHMQFHVYRIAES